MTAPRYCGLAGAQEARGRNRFTAFLVALAALTVVKLGLTAGEVLAPPPAAASPPAPPQVADAAPPALPEPAAGPEDDTDEPTDDAGDVPAPAPPATTGRSPAALEPMRLTASEVAVLHQLAARREALDRRERALDERGLLIETAAAALERQIARLRELREQIAATVEAHDTAEDAKLASLVKIYETMKPKAAAEIFDRLEMAVLIRVVERMREAKSADVLARMDPVKAKQVTSVLARRTELLEAGREGDRGALPASGR